MDAVAHYEALHDRLGVVTGQAGTLPPNDHGTIAWGTAWVLRSYVLMFEATGNPLHLRRLARAVEHVRDQRDDVRGVRDHRGASDPVWSSTGSFTIATAAVPGPDGATVLEVHVCPPGALGTTVEVAAGSVAHTFTLTVANGSGGRDVLPDLSLDRSHPRWAPAVAYAAYPGTTRTTLTVPEAVAGAVAVVPAPGRYSCHPARVALAAQTGMITHPVAALVRLARANADLVGPEVLRRVDAHLEDVVAALSVHDAQWRTRDGMGWYAWPREQPVSFAGVALPTNEFVAMGRAHLELAQVTRDGPHAERATAIAACLRGQMRPSGRSLVWSYWPDFGDVYTGWSKTGSPETDVSLFRPEFAPQPKLEDVTHALLDVEFAAAYASTPDLPQVFTERDLRRLAATYRHRVARHRRSPLWPGVASSIGRDLSRRGRLAEPAQQRHAAGWLALVPWQPHLREAVLPVMRRHLRDDGPERGVDAYCAALVARWG